MFSVAVGFRWCYEDAHYDGHRYEDAPRYEDEYMKGDPKGKGLNSKGQAKNSQKSFKILELTNLSNLFLQNYKQDITSLKTNIVPETLGLEDEFHLGARPPGSCYVRFLVGVNLNGNSDPLKHVACEGSGVGCRFSWLTLLGCE